MRLLQWSNYSNMVHLQNPNQVCKLGRCHPFLSHLQIGCHLLLSSIGFHWQGSSILIFMCYCHCHQSHIIILFISQNLPTLCFFVLFFVDFPTLHSLGGSSVKRKVIFLCFAGCKIFICIFFFWIPYDILCCGQNFCLMHCCHCCFVL